MKKKAVVLFSGGLDSSTVLAIAKEKGFDVYALSFSYGQRHKAELECAKELAEIFEVKKHLVIPVGIDVFEGSSLTSDKIEIPKSRGDLSSEIPSTYVPARNTIFLSFALGWAEVLGSMDIFIGVNALDFSGYPDCRPEFIEAFQVMATLATKSGVESCDPITIHTPLIELTKAEIIERGLRLGIDYGKTLSCYDPDEEGRACGRCDSCLLRLRGFKANNLSDPANYQSGKPELAFFSTCSGRKAIPAPEALQSANLPDGELEVRCRAWINLLVSTESEKTIAEDLYEGDHWLSSKVLPELARKRGFESGPLNVISAGLGLFPASVAISSYKAAFSSGSSDRVADSKPERQQWWSSLSEWEGPEVGAPRTLTEFVRRNPNAVIFLVASKSYLSAIEVDLKEAISLLGNPDRLMIISLGADRKGPFQEFLLPLDERIRQITGGSSPAVNARAARFILSECPGDISKRSNVEAFLLSELEKVTPVEKPKRDRLSDRQILNVLREEKAQISTMTPTAAIEHLHSKGIACGQSRLRRILSLSEGEG